MFYEFKYNLFFNIYLFYIVTAWSMDFVVNLHYMTVNEVIFVNWKNPMSNKLCSELN
jgi:hypothetical protein